jgi:hypothetical protein
MNRRKQKSIYQFLVFHLQKVIFFISGLKFWNTFCLLTLLIAHFIFTTENGDILIQSPSDENLNNLKIENLTPSPLSPTQFNVNPPTCNEQEKINIDLIDSSSSSSSVYLIYKELNLENTNASTSLSLQNNYKKNQSKPSTNKIFIAILTFMTIIDHLIPTRIIRVIARLTRK